MFGWSKKNPEPEVFRPKERWIYAFWDGQQDRKVDPLPLYKAVVSKGPSLSIDMRVADSPSKDNVKAHTALINQLREIFSVKPFEDGGLTERETEDLFYNFWDFCAERKNECSPTSIPAADQLPNTGSTSGENQPTANGSGFGSTEDATVTSKPR